MKNFFDNQGLFVIVWKWKLHLLLVGVVTIIAAAIFSSSTFITPRYKSTARIYPVNLSRLSDESKSEQMEEIINSQDIKLRMIKAFRLDTVYHISKDDPHYLSYILNEFNDWVSFKKTEYETVEITVLDENPKRAADMCDSVITFYDQKVGEMHRLKYFEVVKISQKGMNEINYQIDTLLTRMNQVREKYQILDYDNQVKEVTRGYMTELAENKSNTPGGRKIEQIVDNLEKKGGEYQLMSNMMNTLTNQRDSLKRIYFNSLSDAEKRITYSHRVQNSIPADKKSYPVRWLIVLLSVIATEFLAMLTIFGIEGIKPSK